MQNLRSAMRAVAFVHEHAAKLKIDTRNYSLWGGSAGARMTAWLVSFDTENFGEKKYPRPAAVIMQYTGLSEVFGNEPPAQIEIFDGLSHGFGFASDD